MINQYLSSVPLAQQYGKQFMMFETNTASCGGFPGISDSFASALWAVDYALQMAYSNFSGALLHVGGQDDTYNVSVGTARREGGSDMGDGLLTLSLFSLF